MTTTRLLAIEDYDLAATLSSGQAFRWRECDGAWEGVVAGRWVRLAQRETAIAAETAVPVADWEWLTSYLQTEVDLDAVLGAFPNDEPLRNAVAACRGLRLLRQEPWECLASFLLSSTKQIQQIRQIVATLCARYGEPVAVPRGHAMKFSFPSASRVASVSEAELRGCKMGFRARYLRAAAQAVASGDLDLDRLRSLPLAEARAELERLPGVGRKIADCTLLFSLGFHTAFPIDTWIAQALRRFYFRGRQMPPRRLADFVAGYFGPQAGYAQQYLFHFVRIHPEALKPQRRQPVPA